MENELRKTIDHQAAKIIELRAEIDDLKEKLEKSTTDPIGLIEGIKRQAYYEGWEDCRERAENLLVEISSDLKTPPETFVRI